MSNKKKVEPVMDSISIEQSNEEAMVDAGDMEDIEVEDE